MDSILRDNPASVHNLPDGPESTPEAEPTTEKDPKADATSTAAPKVEAEPEDEGPDPKEYSADGLRKALTAERKQRRGERKRAQDLQRQLDHLTGQMDARRASDKPAAEQPKQPTQEDLSAEFYADPVAFVQRHGKAAVPDVDQKLTRAKIDISVVYAKQAHADYDEMEAAFGEAVKAQPHLGHQMAAAPSPAEFAYQTGKLFREAQEFGGDITAWKEKEREKIRAELSGGGVEGAKSPAKVPTRSIASARGSGNGAAKSWAGPTEMRDILAPRTRAAR